MANPSTSPGFDYTDLPLVGRRDPESGLVYFGTVVSGVFVKLAVRKIAGLDADIATAAAVASGQWKPPATADGSEPNTNLPHIVLPAPSPPVEGSPEDELADQRTGENTTTDHDAPAPAPGPDETPTTPQ